MSDEEIIFPGNKLAIEEEFLPGGGVYVEKGYLFSLFVGDLLVGKAVISIKPKIRYLKQYDRGDFVLCRVTDTLRSIIFCDISSLIIDNKKYLALKDGKVTSDRRGRNNVNLLDFNTNDVLLAKISYNDEDSYTLDIGSSDEVGSVMSLCDRCGYPMDYDDKSHLLKCKRCKNVKEAKVSKYYGNFNSVIKFVKENLS